MKPISFSLKKLIVVLVIIAISAGCKGHKKAKCNDCPKWSKADTREKTLFPRVV